MIAYTRYTFDGRVRLEAESLVEWGYRVCFVVPKEGKTPRNYVLRGVSVIEVNVTEYGGKSRVRYLWCYLSFFVRALVACTALFFRDRVEVIHVHNMPNTVVLSAVIPRLLGCKVVLDVHDTVIETYKAKFGYASSWVVALLKCEEWLCCCFAHTIICVNHVQREVLIERHVPADKIATVITMPRFNTEAYSSRREEGHVGFRMVNHGTMSRRLGNDLIVRAATRLVHDIPGFELHMIGGGDDLSEFKSLSESLGISNSVIFHDAVPWDELASKLATMDVGIVANRVNSATELMLPSKLIDYVVLGIPAIVPRLRAIGYYFSDDMVSYFEPEDIDSMVEATIQLYKDGNRRNRQVNNSRAFLAKYGWDTPENDLRGVYQRLRVRGLADESEYQN